MITLENAGLRAPRKMSLGSGLHSQKRIRAPVSKMIGLRAPQQKFQGSKAPRTPPLGPWLLDGRTSLLIYQWDCKFATESEALRPSMEKAFPYGTENVQNSKLKILASWRAPLGVACNTIEAADADELHWPVTRHTPLPALILPTESRKGCRLSQATDEYTRN